MDDWVVAIMVQLVRRFPSPESCFQMFLATPMAAQSPPIAFDMESIHFPTSLRSTPSPSKVWAVLHMNSPPTATGDAASLVGAFPAMFAIPSKTGPIQSAPESGPRAHAAR